MADQPKTSPENSRTQQLLTDAETGELRRRHYHLVAESEPPAARELSEGNIIVGSHPDCDWVLTDSSVSRRHVEFRVTADGLEVVDLSSTNGTFLHGSRIKSAVVEPGVLLKLGRLSVRVEVKDHPVGRRDTPPASFGRMLGQSARMRLLFGTLARVAPTEAKVLIRGETGVGKELAATAIHEHSSRREGPLVIVDCAATPRELVQSELFGHVRGSFTGAAGDRRGAFEEARGGTLFLDEVGELELDVQPKLLRVMENRAVKRVGENTYRNVDVRIVAATHRNLEREMKEGRFREDLYYRLAVVQVEVPPLRERAEDIPMIVGHMVAAGGHTPQPLSRGTLDALQGYHWPGNLRELRNAIERALALSGGDWSQFETVLGEATGGPATLEGTDCRPFKEEKAEVVEAFERRYLTRLLSQHEGNISRAAAAAGLGRNYLYQLMKKNGMMESSEPDG